jgi:hypothetical protein
VNWWTRIGRVVVYGFAVVTTCIIVFFGMRLEELNLSVPMQYGGDVLLILPMVQALHEGGSHWHTDRLGAPGRQELFDFPVVDELHFTALRGLLYITDEPVAAYNLYYLLTYPLTTLTALFALRRWGLSFPAATTAAVLFALLPYHQIRGLGHYFLAAYYILPLTMHLVLALLLGRTKLSLGNIVGGLIICVLTGLAGAYYAYFSCALLLAAALYGSVLRRSWRPLRNALGCIAVIVAVGVALHLPTILHHREYGANTEPTQRLPEEAEIYGLKLTQLFLPIENHRIPMMARIRATYDTPARPLQNDNRTSTLGVVGSLGFVLGVLAVFWPKAHRGLRAVGFLIVFMLLLSTVGGLGAVFNHVISPQVRAYNRISIFIAFVSLFLVMWSFDRLTRRRRYLRVSRWFLGPLILTLGILDITDGNWFRSSMYGQRDRIAEKYKLDARYFREVEFTWGNAQVFQLPYIPYPETFRMVNLEGYDHARGFLHTKTTRWSFGTMRGREVDQWQREVATSEVPTMLRRLVLRGFDALAVDSRGYEKDEFERLEADLKTALQVSNPLVKHVDGFQSTWDLRPLRDRLQKEYAEEYPRFVLAESEALRMLWLKGFVSYEPPARDGQHTWCQATGESWILNPKPTPQRVSISFVPRTTSALPTTLRVQSEMWSETLTIHKDSGVHTASFTVPPGRYRIQWVCEKPKDWKPIDSRYHVFFVAQFRLTEDK